MPDAMEIGQEIDMLIQVGEESAESKKKSMSKLIKLIENTIVDLARIPFIRENPVFQSFLHIESKDSPFRSLALPDHSMLSRT